MIDISAQVDVSDFERTAERYARVAGKTLEAAQWRGLSQWARKAIAYRKTRQPSQATKARISRLFSSRQWRLYSWLAKGRDIGHGEHALRDFARRIATSRKQSVGFPMALLVGLSKAAAAKSRATLKTGLRGWARLTAGGLGRVASIDAGAEYQFKSDLTSAKQMRNPAPNEQAALDALAATQSAQVADMETYIQRKLEEGNIYL
jgi:hypothetical protein